MNPVRLTGLGVVKDILFNNLRLAQLLVDAFRGLRVCAGPVQHVSREAPLNLIKAVTRVLFKAGIDPLDTPRVVQHDQKIGRY